MADFALIKFSTNGQILVVRASSLLGYNRGWRNLPESWPNETNFFSDEGADELCQILFVGGRYILRRLIVSFVILLNLSFCKYRSKAM